MHQEAKTFTLFVKSILPEYFKSKCILDVGSGDINGNNSTLFENCEYNGNDVIAAKNVTIVSKTKDLPFEDNSFDTIISTECFEHDPEYKQSFSKIYAMLKPGGLFCFTCASTNRPEHGTRRTTPEDSYGTIGNIPDMIDHYKNLTIKDLNDVIPLDDSFSVWDSYYNSRSCDLYFLGIKKGGNFNPTAFPLYNQIWVERTNPTIPLPPKNEISPLENYMPLPQAVLILYQGSLVGQKAGIYSFNDSFLLKRAFESLIARLNLNEKYIYQHGKI